MIVANECLDQKLAYIHNNPVENEIVEEPEHYIYSSAGDYVDKKGLLNVNHLPQAFSLWYSCFRVRGLEVCNLKMVLASHAY